MTNRKTTTGRTVFDLISEYPKIAIGLFSIIIFGILIFFMFGGKSVKVGGLEVANAKTLLKPDTIVIIERETIFIEKEKIITKYIETETKNVDVSTKIKQEATSVEVKTPSNINTGTNNGVIGNNNNFFAKGAQRQLTKSGKAQLIRSIDEALASKKKDKTSCIYIASISDTEAYNYAKEIEIFLIQMGYKPKGKIGSFRQSPPIEGLDIGFFRNCVQIKVGYMKKE